MLTVVLDPVARLFEPVQIRRVHYVNGEPQLSCDDVEILPDQNDHLMDVIKEAVQVKLHAGHTVDA